jgi:predicted house-cleaning NTP pyrophosphatase (Maf/HAM1 superfamily)
MVVPVKTPKTEERRSARNNIEEGQRMFKAWRMARVATVAAVATVLCGGTAAATTAGVQAHHAATGTVDSVNDVSTAGACGSAGTPGDFTMASHGTTYTVDVGATTTTFKDQNVSSPSFANVCAGDKVRSLGTVSTNDIVTATEVIVIPPRPQQVAGIVDSVNGANTAGACGTAGTAGDFTMTSHSTTYTVDVDATTTTFKDQNVSSPSFANVCAGDKVRSLGTVSTNDIVTATEVIVIPPRPQQVAGIVDSVNGASTAGACGTAGTAGDFTMTSHNTTYTVDVDATTTTFSEHGVSAPSFANVCAGDNVGARGAVSTNDIVTATEVIVIPPRPQHVAGIVDSVNGASTAGACGTAGTAGDFTVTSQGTTYTVDAGATTTTFSEHGVSAPSFANVCAGDNVRALGTVSTNDIVTATKVVVIPPRPQHVSGTVASVNGTSTCGAAGTAGDFTVTSDNTTRTVDVGVTKTTFKDQNVSAPSFANVCAGDNVRALGTVSTNDIMTATEVVVIPPPR